MPDNLLGSAIGGAFGFLGSLASNASTARQNRLARKWARQSYERERQDSIAFWNMQNAYNSPQAQMQRFKDAGLNPNLIYGQSNESAAPSPPSMSNPQFRTADWSGLSAVGGVLGQYYDLEAKQAQVDNLRAQNTVLLEEGLLKDAQRQSTLQGIRRSQFDLDLDTELRDVTTDARRENLRKLRADIGISLREDERRAALSAASLRESAERVLNMRLEGGRLRAATANLWKDDHLKQLDIELRRNGIMPTDPIYARILGRVVNAYSDTSGSSGSWWQRLGDFFK